MGDSISLLVDRTEPLHSGPITIDPILIPWDRLTDQLLGAVGSGTSQAQRLLSRFATSTARTVFNVVFIFIISVYMAIDLPNFGDYI